MKRIENLPLHFMPKQSLDNILNDDILINNGNDGRLFDEVISFKQTI